MSLVQFNKVYKQFAGEYILRDVNFTIEEKDKIGLVGVNGAGKSTIIRMLLGEERIDGNENNLNEFGEIVKSGATKIGYLSQNTEFSDEKNTIYEEMMTIFEEERKIWDEIQKVNMLMGTADEDEMEKLINKSAELSSIYEAKNGYEIEYKIKQVLTGLELTGEYENLLLQDLSGGERTRVSLAKLLLSEPDLLILDEPTNHLDIKYQLELMTIVKRLDATVVAAIHDLNLAAIYCDRLIALKDGSVVCTGTPHEVLTEETIRHIYGVSAAVQTLPNGRLNIIYNME